MRTATEKSLFGVYIYIYTRIYNPEYILRGIVIYQFFIALFQIFLARLKPDGAA